MAAGKISGSRVRFLQRGEPKEWGGGGQGKRKGAKGGGRQVEERGREGGEEGRPGHAHVLEDPAKCSPPGV